MQIKPRKAAMGHNYTLLCDSVQARDELQLCCVVLQMPRQHLSSLQRKGLLCSTSGSLEPFRALTTFCAIGTHMENISTDTDLSTYTHMHSFHTSTCAENTASEEGCRTLALFQACSNYGEHEERTGFSPTGTVSKQPARLQLER